jgi:hypothetical protein
MQIDIPTNYLIYLAIMGFYIFLSYIAFPGVFFYFFGQTLTIAGTGFVVGSIVSIVLWFAFGSKLVK